MNIKKLAISQNESLLSKINKKIFLLFFLISIGSFGQSIIASGNAYLVYNNDFNNVEKSEVYLVFTIRENTIDMSVNENNSRYNIINSNLTNGGRNRNYILKEVGKNDEMKITITLLSNFDVIVFPWDPLNGIIGYIKTKFTADDKRILGLYRNN